MQRSGNHFLQQYESVLMAGLQQRLNTNLADIPPMTQELSPEERNWLSSHSLSDLICIEAPHGEEHTFVTLGKNIAIAVISQMATDAIVSQFSTDFGKPSHDISATNRTTSEPLEPNIEIEIDHMINEESCSIGMELDGLADRAADSMDEIFQSTEPKPYNHYRAEDINQSSQQSEHSELNKALKDKVLRKQMRKIAREYMKLTLTKYEADDTQDDY